MSDANAGAGESPIANGQSSKPAQVPTRARTVKTSAGVFVHVGDFKACLRNEQLLLECAAMIRVAKDLGHPPLTGVMMCALNALDTVTGDLAAVQEMLRKQN